MQRSYTVQHFDIYFVMTNARQGDISVRALSGIKHDMNINVMRVTQLRANVRFSFGLYYSLSCTAATWTAIFYCSVGQQCLQVEILLFSLWSFPHS